MILMEIDTMLNYGLVVSAILLNPQACVFRYSSRKAMAIITDR
jgi:hypothetical protein